MRVKSSVMVASGFTVRAEVPSTRASTFNLCRAGCSMFRTALIIILAMPTVLAPAHAGQARFDRALSDEMRFYVASTGGNCWGAHGPQQKVRLRRRAQI